jgi:hypothetical protein
MNHPRIYLGVLLPGVVLVLFNNYERVFEREWRKRRRRR